MTRKITTRHSMPSSKVLRSGVTALYSVYVVLLVVGLTGALDFASVVVGCLSVHLGFGFLGWMIGGDYHPWPSGKLVPRYILFLQVIDGAQFITLIVAGTQLERRMPTGLVVVVSIVVFTGIGACFVKFNMLKEEERRLSTNTVLGLAFITVSGVLTIAAIATLDNESDVMGLLVGALLSFLGSSLAAARIFGNSDHQCPPGEPHDQFVFGSLSISRLVAWSLMRAVFILSGLLFLTFESIAVGLFWGHRTNVVAKNCALSAALCWAVGVTLMHTTLTHNKYNCDSSRVEGMHLVPPGESYPVLGDRTIIDTEAAAPGSTIKQSA